MKKWEDPKDPGNTIRPEIRCIGCGTFGCVTSWGPWCFRCNVKRMQRINASLTAIAQTFGLPHNPT